MMTEKSRARKTWFSETKAAHENTSICEVPVQIEAFNKILEIVSAGHSYFGFKKT